MPEHYWLVLFCSTHSLQIAQTLSNIKALLQPGERLYVATDEKDRAFFKALAAEHELVMWHDLEAVLGDGYQCGARRCGRGGGGGRRRE